MATAFQDSALAFQFDPLAFQIDAGAPVEPSGGLLSLLGRRRRRIKPVIEEEPLKDDEWIIWWD